MFAYPLTAAVTLISMLVYIWMATRVGAARARHEVPAPLMTGPDEFNRVLRVQENTMETLILFLPVLWLYALTISDLYAAAIGVFFPIGRILYALGYYAASDKRGKGFMIGFVATIILLFGSIIGTGQILWSQYYIS